ncbi:FAD/NAD(P)-binding protein [Sulfitobacter sp. 1A12157]
MPFLLCDFVTCGLSLAVVRLYGRAKDMPGREMQVKTARIAVIGFGPRGLGALEALAHRLIGTERRIEIDIYEPGPHPGAGPNFAPSEPAYCLLNIPNRDIAIRPPKGSRVGHFAQWQDRPVDPDSFPSRAEMGRYLMARRDDLFAQGFTKTGVTCRVLPASVARISPAASGWRVQSESGSEARYDEVLLTLGQPSVAPDAQWAEWQEHAARSGAEVAQAYPAAKLRAQAATWQGKQVAIRGLGLSTYDVLRGLTMAQGGRFDTAGYHASGREPSRILPFSLNGHPPFPKPQDAAFDALFDPTPEETAGFSQAAIAAVSARPEAAPLLISDALLPVVVHILTPQNVRAEQIENWLDAEWSDPGAQDQSPPLEALRHGIDLAAGEVAPSIGYTVGQVWRKWQDAWRAAFNPGNASPQTAKRLIDFDEGLKRYSYGPPLSSARELLALIDAGLVDLSFATNPQITDSAQGWTLQAEGGAAEVSVIVDAVLPAPELSGIVGPPLPDLISQGFLSPLSSDLAAATAPDGTLRGHDGRPVPGLCLLGRLALGSVTAVDSLHDCFGQSADRWAQGVIDRLSG